MEIPAFIPENHWQAYLEMRKSIKKPPTEFAIKLIVGKLLKMKNSGEDIEKVLEQSIVNNWTDVYPFKDYEKKTQMSINYQTPNEKAKSWADRLTGKIRENERTNIIIDINTVESSFRKVD